MLEKLFRELFERVEPLSMQGQGDDFLYIASRIFEVENLAYLGVNLPAKNKKNYFVHNTYSAEWAMRYETENYISVDPIVSRGMTSLLPVDWSDLSKLGPKQRKFFGEAQEHGVGKCGLTFPVRGIFGETAVFSITASFSDKTWEEFKRKHLRDMRLIADFVHQRVINSADVPPPNRENQLTARELECLQWSSAGKTYEDIASIMNITPRTVRFFLENARTKLGSLNTTHAVVNALARGII